MKKIPLTSEQAAQLPISSSIQADSHVYVAGQAGLRDGRIVGPDIESQARVTMENIRKILEDKGLGMQNVVKMNVYLTDRELYNRFNDVYRTFFNAPYPARTVVYCSLNFDLLVEIDAIANSNYQPY